MNEDWNAAFAAADRQSQKDPSFREPLERLLYALEDAHEPWVLERAQKMALEALYPESGGVPPWRNDERDVDVPQVSGGSPGGPGERALGVGAGEAAD